MPKLKGIKIEAGRACVEDNSVRIWFKDGRYLESSKVASVLLYEILKELKKPL